MCKFQDHHFGKPLPEPMVSFLTDYIKKQDIKDIAKQHNISESTVNLVRYGHNNLAVSNAPAIVSLMKRAVENCGNLSTKASKDIKTFEKLMQDEMVLK